MLEYIQSCVCFHIQIQMFSYPGSTRCTAVGTLFTQKFSFDSVESLTLSASSLQLLLALGQPSLLLPHRPLVVLVNVLQLLI